MYENVESGVMYVEPSTRTLKLLVVAFADVDPTTRR